MKNLTNPRIVYIRSIAEVEEAINQDYNSIYPVPLRAVIASIGDNVDLSFDVRNNDDPSEKERVSFMVKTIEDILRDGTEFDVDEIRLKNRHDPSHLPEFPVLDGNGLCTRVSYYNGGPSKAFDYLHQNLIDSKVKRANVPEDAGSSLRPALLIYDKSKLGSLEGLELPVPYEVLLPSDPVVRSTAILKAYIIQV